MAAKGPQPSHTLRPSPAAASPPAAAVAVHLSILPMVRVTCPGGLPVTRSGDRGRQRRARPVAENRSNRGREGECEMKRVDDSHTRCAAAQRFRSLQKVGSQTHSTPQPVKINEPMLRTTHGPHRPAHRQTPERKRKDIMDKRLGGRMLTVVEPVLPGAVLQLRLGAPAAAPPAPVRAAAAAAAAVAAELLAARRAGAGLEGHARVVVEDTTLHVTGTLRRFVPCTDSARCQTLPDMRGPG